MKKILIHHNFRKESVATKDKLVRILRDERIDIDNDKPDLIVSIGGDGTMLNAIRKHGKRHIPFIGINTGSLGFLPTISALAIREFINVIKSKRYVIDSYPLLRVAAVTVKGESFQCVAFNEVVIKQADPRLMLADIFVNERWFNRFAGDGLIVSTAIGSTGYAMWAGGASVHPDVAGMQLIPINPNNNAIHNPITRPLILPEREKLSIVIDRPKHLSVIAGCDGVKISKYAMSRIDISRHHHSIKILRCLPLDYYSLYGEKILANK